MALAAVLKYAAKGHPVLPIIEGGKMPLTPSGLNDATVDAATIRSWCEQYPSANWAMRCDGLLVLDVDPGGDLAALEATFGPLPETLTQATPRGGKHLLYRLPAGAKIGNSTRGIGSPTGIDIRGGDKGYIVVAPSSNDNGSYKWENRREIAVAPEWLVNALTRSESVQAASTVVRGGGSTPYGDAALDVEAANVSGAPEGQRNTRLNDAAFALGQLEAGGELVPGEAEATLLVAALAAGLSQSEAIKTIKRGMRDGSNHPRSAPGTPRSTPTSASERATDTPTAPGRLTWQSLSDVPMRSIVFVDKPLWQANAFHLVVGRKGMGKGTLIAGFASRVTRGELGDKRNVVWIGSEDSASIDIHPRVVAAGGDPTRITIVKDGWVQLPRDIDEISALMAEIGGVGLLIIDPVGNHISGKESNSETDIRDAIAPLNLLADDDGCMVIGVRHLTEKECRNGVLAAILGSSAWVQVPRAVLAIARDDEDASISHVQCVAGNRLPANTPGRMFRIDGVLLPELENEITVATWIGESAKDVETMLTTPAAMKEPSSSETARQLIRTILEEEGDQESDALDARVAQETSLSAKTVKNIRSDLREAGLVKASPEKDVDGKIVRWRVRRTRAPWPDSETPGSPDPDTPTEPTPQPDPGPFTANSEKPPRTATSPSTSLGTEKKGPGQLPEPDPAPGVRAKHQGPELVPPLANDNLTDAKALNEVRQQSRDEQQQPDGLLTELAEAETQ